MKVSIILRMIAKLELAESAERYEQQKAGLGVDFVANVKEVLDEFAGNPRRYPIVFGDVREGIVSRFPYCVYFRVKANRLSSPLCFIPHAILPNGRSEFDLTSRKRATSFRQQIV